jgi:hypothetical protein
MNERTVQSMNIAMTISNNYCIEIDLHWNIEHVNNFSTYFVCEFSVFVQNFGIIHDQIQQLSIGIDVNLELIFNFLAGHGLVDTLKTKSATIIIRKS